MRDETPKQAYVLALVENLQRADLNPLEEADGYQRLIDEFGLTQLQVAEAVGKGQLMVNSTHHQAVKKLGNQVVSSATSPDGVIEAIESTAHVFAVGVQWHPEYMLNTLPVHGGIYKVFIQKARDYRR